MTWAPWSPHRRPGQRAQTAGAPGSRTCYRPFQMHGSVGEHIGAATLEDYSLQELGPEAVEGVESHLLICAACRNRLAGIEPFNTVHFTQDGPFYLRVTHLRDGSFAEIGRAHV